MSRITRLRADRPTRRAIVVDGVHLVLWLREWGGAAFMAIAPPRTRKSKLQWKRFSDVMANAFAMDMQLLFGKQQELLQDASPAAGEVKRE